MKGDGSAAKSSARRAAGPARPRWRPRSAAQHSPTVWGPNPRCGKAARCALADAEQPEEGVFHLASTSDVFFLDILALPLLAASAHAAIGHEIRRAVYSERLGGEPCLEKEGSALAFLAATRKTSEDNPKPEGVYELSTRECSDLIAAQLVLKHARDEWCSRVAQLRKEARAELEKAELEWANIATAQRMLRANIGDAQKVKMFVQALEMRAEYAMLLSTMRCESRSDIRILGRDREGRPVVYMCARSQTAPLCSVRDQLLITFEAACRLVGDMGKVSFVVDMHGLQPHLNMDIKSAKTLVDLLGTVFAERIDSITIVDFSKAMWWMVKPLVAPATRKKFAFASLHQARELCKQRFDDSLYLAASRTFDINRDPDSTEEERLQHARETTFGSALA